MKCPSPDQRTITTRRSPFRMPQAAAGLITGNIVVATRRAQPLRSPTRTQHSITPHLRNLIRSKGLIRNQGRNK